MSDENFRELGEVIGGILQRRLRRVHTVAPAKIIKYDKDKQLAQCQITVKAIVVDEDQTVKAIDVPPINNVPVIFPGAGGFRILFPVKPDDTMALLFSETSLDEWAKGDGITPADPKLDTPDLRFRYQDGMMIPGLHPPAKAWTGAADDHMVIGADGGAVQMHLFADKLYLTGEAPASFIALAAKVDKQFQSIANFLNTFTATGTPTDAGSWAAAKLLLASGAWPIPTEPFPTSTASAKVKSD